LQIDVAVRREHNVLQLQQVHYPHLQNLHRMSCGALHVARCMLYCMLQAVLHVARCTLCSTLHAVCERQVDHPPAGSHPQRLTISGCAAAGRRGSKWGRSGPQRANPVLRRRQPSAGECARTRAHRREVIQLSVRGANEAGPSPVPVQMWRGRAQSRCRCGRGEPSPSDTKRRAVGPVPLQMWQRSENRGTRR
jgi:hypothetical protein